MNFFASKKIITAALVAGLLFAGSAVQAQSTSTDQTTIEALQEQVQQLQERVQELRQQLQDRLSDDDESDSATSTDDDFRSRMRLRIDRQLRQGDRGPAVERLQELLSSNSEIYPEGLVTGYFGPLTSSAVARLQARMGLPSVGNVGPQTLSRVNQLLEEGAGNSGMVPPGLLTAPGIQRALSDDTSTSSDDAEDDDDDESAQRSGLDIEGLSVPERIKARLRSAFKKFEYRFKSGDDDDDEEELEIEVEIKDGEARVKIEYVDGSEEEFRYETEDNDEIIDLLLEETNLSKEEIESAIEFENDDDDEEDDDEDDDDDDDDEDDDDDDDDDTSTSSDES